MKVSPSILSANFAALKEDIERTNKASYLHIDVMDGVFVPNISFGASIQKQIRPLFKDMIFDTHLMIIEPHKYIKDFVDAGSDYITFHIEAKSNINETIDLIHSYGKKAGLSIKPNTDPKDLIPYLNKIELVLVMSVEPGFGGQKFMPSAVDKIKELYELRKENNYHYLIEVDGGINEETVQLCKNAGIDVVVAGSYVMNADNRKERIENLLN